MSVHLVEWEDGGRVDGAPVWLWTCRCGAAGLTEDAAGGHLDEQAASVIAAMTPAVLATALLASAGGDHGRGAAVRLLIGHEYWLGNGYMRALMRGRWNADGRLCVAVDWRRTAAIMTAFDGPLWAAELPSPLADALREHHQAALHALEGDPVRKIMMASTSERRMLALACSLSGAIPGSIYDNTIGLDNTNRGLVLAAVRHLLSGGGEITLPGPGAWAATAGKET